MIGSATRSGSISKVRLWTGRVIGAWLVLFLAFDAAVKLLKLRVAVEGTISLGYPEHLVVILGIVELVSLIAYVVPRNVDRRGDPTDWIPRRSDSDAAPCGESVVPLSSCSRLSDLGSYVPARSRRRFAAV